MKKLRILAIILVCLLSNTIQAGWSYRAHLNYLKESVAILDYYDFKMCESYKGELKKGFIEGEIQYKFRVKGQAPKWLGELSPKEVQFLQGHTINLQDIDQAANFFYNRISNLKDEISEMNRPYSEVMFELAYYLHSINNILIPEYKKGYFPEQPLAANTANLTLDLKEVGKINDLRSWIKQMLTEKIRMRNVWSQFAINNNRDGFIDYANKANKMNIYTLSSILRWVINDCYGPEHIEVRNQLEKMHENHTPQTNGRKEWDHYKLVELKRNDY